MADNRIGGIIWTNNALAKLAERNVPKDMAMHTFNFPDEELRAKIPGALQLKKKIDRYNLSMIVKKTERGEWLVISFWCEPRWSPVQGQKNNQTNQPKDASLFSRIMKDLRSIVGLK